MSAMRRVRPVWAGVAAACAVVVVASLAGSVATGISTWKWRYTYFAQNADWSVEITRGGLRVEHAPSTLPIPHYVGFISMRREVSPSGWWFRAGRIGQATSVNIPLWVIGLAASGLGALAWNRSRRNLPGHCPKCNYNLAGLIGNVCPECGTDCTQKSKEPSP